MTWTRPHTTGQCWTMATCEVVSHSQQQVAVVERVSCAGSPYYVWCLRLHSCGALAGVQQHDDCCVSCVYHLGGCKPLLCSSVKMLTLTCCCRYLGLCVYSSASTITCQPCCYCPCTEVVFVCGALRWPTRHADVNERIHAPDVACWVTVPFNLASEGCKFVVIAVSAMAVRHMCVEGSIMCAAMFTLGELLNALEPGTLLACICCYLPAVLDTYRCDHTITPFMSCAGRVSLVSLSRSQWQYCQPVD
jgi:hypothetical protein